MNDLNTFIIATQSSIEFCNIIINDPKTPQDKKLKFEKYLSILLKQQEISVESLVLNCSN